MDYFFNELLIGWYLAGDLLVINSNDPATRVFIFVFDRLSLWLLRNFTVVGFIFLIYSKFLTKNFPERQTSKYPGRKTIIREILTSVLASTLAALTVICFLLFIYNSYPGLSKIYLDINEYSAQYFLFSIFFLVIGNEIYFYFCHRLLHTDWFFKKIHYVHHLSKESNPLTGSSFHPVEAFILYFYPNLLMLSLPLHPYALSFFTFFNIIFVTIGHSGWEFIPTFLRKKPWSYIFTNVFHHSMHHREGVKNFSLYMNILDHICKTNHPSYYQELDEFNNKVESTG